MPYYNYKCESCEFEELRYICQEDDLTWREQVHVKGATQAQLDKMDFAKGDDPRDLDVFKEVNYGKGLPDKVKCNKCKKKKGVFFVKHAPMIKNGRNSYAAKKERHRFDTDGMDKKQAEQFYQESIQASTERIKAGGDSHYKKIVPNYEELRKDGTVTKINDQDTANKIESLKRANQGITKDGSIGKPNRRPR